MRAFCHVSALTSCLLLLQACDVAAPFPQGAPSPEAPTADLEAGGPTPGEPGEPGAEEGIVGPSTIGHYCAYYYSASAVVPWAGSGVIHVVGNRNARSVRVNSNGPAMSTGLIKAGGGSKPLSKISGSNCLELLVTSSSFEHEGGGEVFGYEYVIDAVQAPYYWSGAGRPNDPADLLEVYDWEVEGGSIHSYGPNRHSVRVEAPFFPHYPSWRPTVVAVTNSGTVEVGGQDPRSEM
jgi:hypothetical protein